MEPLVLESEAGEAQAADAGGSDPLVSQPRLWLQPEAELSVGRKDTNNEQGIQAIRGV
jgi:hypothetical protein